MYPINDKQSAIREIQKFLFVISQKEKSIPHVSIDGYFGDETQLAVLEFQRLYMSELNGKVDKETYDLMYEKYIEVLEERNVSDTGFDSEKFPLKKGDSGNDVSVLNSVLRELYAYYKELSVPYGDFFSLDTESAVKEMQRHFMENESGIVSEQLLSKLKKEVNNREIFKNTK